MSCGFKRYEENRKGRNEEEEVKKGKVKFFKNILGVEKIYWVQKE